MQIKVDSIMSIMYNNNMKYLIVLIYSIISVAYGDNREKVLIVDTGISSKWVDKKYLCPDGEKSIFKEIEDTHGHGSNVYGLLTKDMDVNKYCIVSLKIFDKDGNCSDKDCTGGFYEAIKLIKKDKKIKHLNLSLGGKEEGIDKDLIAMVLKRGGYVTVASGNDGKNLNESCYYYPACYKLKIKEEKFRVVGNSGTIRSNVGSVVTDMEYAVGVGSPAMTGTSQASAIVMGKLLKNR